MTKKASVKPITNLIANKMFLSDDKEKIKHDMQLIDNTIEQTLLGLNLEKTNPTKTLEQDRPK